MPIDNNNQTFVRVTNQDIFNKLVDHDKQFQAIQNTMGDMSERLTSSEARIVRLEKESPVRWAKDNPAHVFILTALVFALLVKAFGLVIVDTIIQVFTPLY
jgi:hypothetical protein